MNSKTKALKFILQLLVFLMPTQLALHFWPSWAHVFGIRVDYLAPTIYLTDLLLVALLVVWIITKIKKFFHFRQRSWLRFSTFHLILTFSILGFVFLNIVSAKVPEVTMFKWLKVGELVFLVYFVKNFKELKTSSLVIPISLSLILFSSIAILQFLKGGSLGGIFYFLGERSFNTRIPGISTMTIFGREFLRPYSTFPHPNALAGYFLVSAILLVGFVKKFTGKMFLISLCFAAVSFIFAFSLGAAAALVFSPGLFLVHKSKNGKHIFNNLIILIFFIILLLSLISPIFIENLNISSELYPESYFRRVALVESAGRMIKATPLLGAGLNNFIVKLPQVGSYPTVSWWLQPVHNIFLLVFSEAGIIGIVLFFYLIFKALKKSLATGHWLLATALIVIVLTGAVDHYWLTLQQNQFLFALILGLSLRERP